MVGDDRTGREGGVRTVGHLSHHADVGSQDPAPALLRRLPRRGGLRAQGLGVRGRPDPLPCGEKLREVRGLQRPGAHRAPCGDREPAPEGQELPQLPD